MKSKSNLLQRLSEKRQLVRRLEKELRGYDTHSVSADVLANDQQYTMLRADLRRAKAVMRSLERQIKGRSSDA
jgi:hypothetical protein